MASMQSDMIKHIESIIDDIPFLTDFLKSGVRLYGGFLRTIISSIATRTLSVGQEKDCKINADGVADSLSIDCTSYLKNGDIDLRYSRRSNFRQKGQNLDSESNPEEIFQRIVKSGGFIEFQSGEYGRPTDSDYNKSIDNFCLSDGLYFIWVPIKSSQDDISEQKFVRFEFLVLRDAASARCDIDYNINNLQFGYNRKTSMYWLSVIDKLYQGPHNDVDTVNEIIKDITDRKITIPEYWGPTTNNLFHLKRLYRIKRLLELGYQLDYNEHNIGRIRSILEKAKQHRHGQPDIDPYYIEWDRNEEESALKESREYHRKYPEGYVDPIVYPKMHVCSLSEPSLYDSENIRTIKHPYINFTLGFFLADETMRTLTTACDIAKN